MEYFTLSNGVRIPKLGLGTSHSGGYDHDTVVHALQNCNYSLVDTAKRYGNEEQIGQAIVDSRREREQFFVTSKLWPTDYGFTSAKSAFYGSLQRLDLDYLDLYLLHWPLVPSWISNPRQVLEETWRALELLYDEGLIRSIGLSNFKEEDLSSMLDIATVTPHVNQCEFHVHNNAVGLRQFCRDSRIQFEGYCPLGKGTLLNLPEVTDMALSYRKTPAQILLRWCVQHDTVAIPKSKNKTRVEENISIFDFELAEKNMTLLDSLHTEKSFVKRENMVRKLDLDLPDGYKLLL